MAGVAVAEEAAATHAGQQQEGAAERDGRDVEEQDQEPAAAEGQGQGKEGHEEGGDAIRMRYQEEEAVHGVPALALQPVSRLVPPTT